MRENVLAERIKGLRKAKGMSQGALAEAIGATQGAVSQWELGIAEPRSRQVAQLAEALEVSADYLLGRTEIPNIYRLAPEPTTLAAHETEDMERVTPERMEEIITAAYRLMMERKRQQ